MMNVAIIGASGIGKFHAREFYNLGVRVVAVLGSTKESSEATAKALLDSFGIKAKPYHKVLDLIKKEKLDAVSICTPLSTHFALAKICLQNGLNVLCEKPFTETLEQAEELFSIASKKNLVLTVNTQWVSMLDEITYDGKIKNLEIKMQSGLKDKEMLVDHLPHFNSFLIKMLGFDEAKSIKINKKSENLVDVTFGYGGVKVKYVFEFNPNRPREISLNIDGKKFERVVDKEYNQFIKSGNRTNRIEDPLKTSIKRFIETIGGKDKLLVNEKEVIANLKLQEEIISKF